MASIYVHVPFCKSKCTYCDFASYPSEIAKAEIYFASLYKEIKGKAHLFKGKKINTVYFGGGTPSYVEPKYIYGALKLIYTVFDVDKSAEITLEVNPGTIDDSKLKVYKNAGVNRFSVGLQSANDKTLKSVNRIHNFEDFRACMELLKDYNTSVDVMLGLPGESFSDVKNTIEEVVKFKNVKHISTYALKAEDGTPMYTKYLNGELLSDDEMAEIYDRTVELLSQKGFTRYEVSNFAKEGYHSKHNLNYWKRGEYLGFGVGASSFASERRFTNTEVIDDYVKSILSGFTAEVFSEEVDENDAKGEYAMLNLRTAFGIDFSEYEKLFKTDFKKDFSEAIKKNAPYLDITSENVKIKSEYLFVQNTILVDFIDF